MKHHSHIKKANALYSICIIAFFSSLHLSIPTYFNSSFLSLFLDEKGISLVYVIISIVTIAGLLLMNTVVRKFGNLRTAIFLILLQIVAFYGLTHLTTANTVLPLFILVMSIISLIGFTIDIFLQKHTELGHTGSVRGLEMTAINAAWILGPLLGGMFIIGENSVESYRGVYIAALALLFPLLYLVFKNFKNFKDQHYVQTSHRQALIRVLKDKDISRIFIINIILQTFYAWMTVYTPIYLHEYIHFNWTEISLIFTIMLIPFVLVELPLGKLADKKWGEKEMLAAGFIIMGIMTAALAFFSWNNLIIWATMLFMTRIGAATAEIMIETYFFKKVDGRDPEVLGLFRITRSVSYFIAPLITTIGLVYTTQSNLFVILGMICIVTLYPILKIKDTN